MSADKTTKPTALEYDMSDRSGGTGLMLVALTSLLLDKGIVTPEEIIQYRDDMVRHATNQLGENAYTTFLINEMDRLLRTALNLEALVSNNEGVQNEKE